MFALATGMVVIGDQNGSHTPPIRSPRWAARPILRRVCRDGRRRPIVVPASTRRLIGNAFELTDLGEQDLKGIAEPVYAWRVERAW